MPYLTTEPGFLDYQYDDSTRLRIRTETHAKYTVGEDDFAAQELEHIRPAAGLALLDVGCGPGRLSTALAGSEMLVVGIDRSLGMLREARPRPGARALYAQADALELPFPDETFDRVVSLGVLYHVRDWQAALREMRRIVRPGGRVVVSTNGRHTLRRLMDMHDDAAGELGYRALAAAPDSFRLDNLAEVQSVFPSARRYVRESALVFPEAEPAVRFYASNRVDFIESPAPDGSHREPLVRAVRARIEAVIAREGNFTVPKSYGYFVADMPPLPA